MTRARRHSRLTAILLTTIALGARLSAQAPLESPIAHAPASERPAIGAALADSLQLLVVEHGVRIVLQAKTRNELDGPFWSDYRRSVRMPRTWEDGDNWLVNYVGHPVHGAAAGFVFESHDPVSRRPQFGLDGAYWATRWRPLAWSAAYSVQFEVGPLSEASVGNVGLHPNTIGWVDYVVTPVGGMGIAIAEDALDRYLIEWFEGHVRNATARAVVRMLFNPSRSMANVSMNHLPWYRGSRPVRGR